MRSAPYRAYQFFAALRAFLPNWAGGLGGQLSPTDRSLVESILVTPAQRQLFDRMSPNDQRHAVAVARTLWQAGHRHSILLQAALLHDVAKSLGQPLTHRVLIVLLEKFWPAALHRLSVPGKSLFGDQPPASSTQQQANPPQTAHLPAWRRPFVIHAYHPVIGAAWVRQAGCQPQVAELVLSHQDEPEAISDDFTRLLMLLKWADNLN